MRRRKHEGQAPQPVPGFVPAATPPPEGERVLIPHDPVNEAAVIAAALADPEARTLLVRRLIVDNFLVKENRAAFAGIAECHRRNLVPDLPTLASVAGADVSDYVAVLVSAVPPPANLEWHVGNVLWDHARATSARGTVPAFLEALRDPRSPPSTVRSLARQLAASYEGYEDRKYLLNPEEVVRERMHEFQKRIDGRAVYPYGIPAIDYLPTGASRLGSGSAPGQITVLTGVSGGGKSTLAAHMVLGILGWEKAQGEREYKHVRKGRRVLYGAWEMVGGFTTELAAVISLGWSRSDVQKGLGEFATQAGQLRIKQRMEEILASGLALMANPFRRYTGERASNERNLDILQGYIAASACEVFIADLWLRCLVDTKPDAESEALLRQQAMVEEMRVHGILLQQQRMKGEAGHGIETRQDTRPTREGIKGSAAWIEVADTIIGGHYPYLTKRVDPMKYEVHLIKQRYGEWPIAVELDWNRHDGSIETVGRPIEYERAGEANPIDFFGKKK